MRQLLKMKDADLNRPYERCLMFGASVLTDAELLAVIIRSGTRGMDATAVASAVLSLHGAAVGLASLSRLTAGDLTGVPGIGEVKAVQIMCVGELSRRIARSARARTLSFADPSSIADYYMEQLRHEEREQVICAMLDTKCSFLGDRVISTGTVSASLLSTREVFKSALSLGAAAIVLIHNHPSGDPAPSAEDYAVTEKAARAGELLDIRLLDHIVIGDLTYCSFRENGILQHPDNPLD